MICPVSLRESIRREDSQPELRIPSIITLLRAVGSIPAALFVPKIQKTNKYKEMSYEN